MEMEDVKRLAQETSQRLRGLVTNNAMVSKPISQGDRHVIPLCELGLALVGGGGTGEADVDAEVRGQGKGEGVGAGGGAKVTPIAVLIVDAKGVRIQQLAR
jgi:uncharacterized spore protein YtfJ